MDEIIELKKFLHDGMRKKAAFARESDYYNLLYTLRSAIDSRVIETFRFNIINNNVRQFWHTTIMPCGQSCARCYSYKYKKTETLETKGYYLKNFNL